MFRTIALAAIASLALTGCIKHEPYGHHTDPGPDNGGHHGGNTEEKVVLNERSDWSISYVTRIDDVNDAGELEQWERFHPVYTGKAYYIIRLVRPDDFKNAYKNDAASFFNFEAESLLTDANNDGVKFWQYTDEVFDAKTPDIEFRRLRSGTWIAFLIELNSECKVTGDYAETTFTIEEEPASDSFSKWLGTWRASNGLMGYDLKISRIDNNFLYRIDGWECLQTPGYFKMDKEYLEGEFYAPNGFLYIRSQFLGSYEDTDFNHGTVDELFMGNIFDSKGLTIITDEGIDIAVMVWQGEKEAELQGAEVKIDTGQGEYETTFHSIQYYMWAHSDSNWYPYHDSVPELPLTMTKLADTRASEAPLAPERTATKASIHHSQPKAGRSSRNSVAKKAVRVK